MARSTIGGSECPTCQAGVSDDASACPRCGQPFEPSEGSGVSAVQTGAALGSRARLLRYAGIGLILLGGPGIALGSWLHDVLRISYLNFNSFDVFGPMNRLVLALGLIAMIAGVVLLILSLRLSQPSEAGAAA